MAAVAEIKIRRAGSWLWPLLAGWALAACSPALNWREVRPEDGSIVALFPCRPDRQARSVEVAGAQVRMQMLLCAAGGATFALGFLDVPDPAAVSRALDELRSVAVANVHGAEPQVEPAAVVGMTPNPHAAHLAFSGRLPDGTAVHEDGVFFTRGLRVYQASVIGRAPSADAVGTFIAGLKLPM